MSTSTIPEQTTDNRHDPTVEKVTIEELEEAIARIKLGKAAVFKLHHKIEDNSKGIEYWQHYTFTPETLEHARTIMV